MSKPITTRLRFVASRKPERIVAFFNGLGFRVQIYGAPVFDGKRWFAWFIPSDESSVDVLSRVLD